MSNYGQQPPYGQPYGPQNPYGQPQQPQPYGQPASAPYGQPQPPYGSPANPYAPPGQAPPPPGTQGGPGGQSYGPGYPPQQWSPQPPPQASRPSLAKRSLIVVTMDTVPGRVVTGVVGDVVGVVARSRELPRELRTANPIDGYAQVLTRSRQDAVDAMVEMAQSAGADAVVGLRYDCSEITQTLSEVSAYGTAVTLDAGTEDASGSASATAGEGAPVTAPDPPDVSAPDPDPDAPSRTGATPPGSSDEPAPSPWASGSSAFQPSSEPQPAPTWPPTSPPSRG